MDRNDRARLMWRAEAYERRTKRPALPFGALGYTGISLLRTLAFRYWNTDKKAAWPSYDELQRATGLCRQTIARAIRRLEEAGFLLVTRRAGWRGGRIVRESNLYRLPAQPPVPLPDDESLRRERQTKTFLSSIEPPQPSLLEAAIARFEASYKARQAEQLLAKNGLAGGALG